jgi:predicted metal-dependent peptidase
MDITGKEERKLKRVKISLMRSPTYAQWQAIMMVGKTIVDDNFPTACTNGRDEIYGRKLIKALPDKELAFVILHENLHKAFRHMTTYVKLWEEDPRLANMACDYVINLMLVDSDPNENTIAFPKNPDGSLMGLLDRRFAGMNSKQVFDILKQEKKKKKGDGEPGDGDGDGSGGGDGPQGFDEHDWEGAKELSEQEKKDLAKDIDRAIRQGKIAADKAGKGAGGMDRELGELLQPKVDWKEALQEFVQQNCAGHDNSSWRKINRRYLSQGIYLPSHVSESIGHIAVGDDTSGSTYISTAIRSRFITEVKSVCDMVNPGRLDLIYWDTVVAGHEIYGDGGLPLDSLTASTKPKGGGGTDPRCMMKYMKEKDIKPDCIIMLTDGEIPNWGDDWNAPILWVVVNKRNIQAPVGKTVMLDD